GECSHPILLRGRIDAVDLATGEVARVYDTASEFGGVLHVACGNRREAVCPACSAVYKRDARQLVRAGLAGGKGIPESVTAHPRRCPHGRDVSCPTRHMDDDPRLGQPMCGDCYDYTAAVVFNAYAGDLWRRFTTYLPRYLARVAGVTGKELRAAVRIRYVKVAEYQARGVVHFHAVIRLDAPGEDYQPPPSRFTTALLCEAIDQAANATTVTAAADSGHGPAVVLRFGGQTDTRPIRHDGGGLPGTGRKLSAQAVGNYTAK